MMRIDDRQLRFEDRLVFLFCEPGFVRPDDVTKPARLDGLRHGVPVLPKLPASPGCVIAIVSLLTSAAKLSLVAADSGPAKPMPNRSTGEHRVAAFRSRPTTRRSARRRAGTFREFLYSIKRE